jgi:hypothetical protein
MLAQGTVGPILAADGVTPNSGIRIGKMGDTIITPLHGRFYEQVSRGNIFSIGCNVTALSANTITLTATSTPIMGIWNPPTSGVNVVMLQLALSLAANTLTAPIPPGPFVLASSLGNNAITLGSAPFNRKTLANTGSAAKAFPGGVALTGLTNNVVIFESLELPNLSGLTDAGTVGASTTTSNATAGAFGLVNFDGGLFIPPGGVLSLLNVTSTTTYSVAGRLMWEEVPV